MQDLLKEGYIGNFSQLVTVRRLVISEGTAKGCEIMEVKTAGGLEADILLDTGLDIGQCRYRGINMSWLSKNGYDSPSKFFPYENEFVNTFPGGLLYTCGLRSVGPANRDNGEWHPLHGRYHSLAAEHIGVDIQNEEIIIQGEIKETALFGHLLQVKRTIRISVWGASIEVEDQVSNLTPRDEEFMMIYHCNFGYPLLSENAQLILPAARRTIPRTDFAQQGLMNTGSFEKPVDGKEEQVFFQKMNDEFWAKIQNSPLGIGMKISWSGETLPILSQWKSMASGDYVLGLEPTNCFIMGRHEERKNGTLPVLKAFTKITNKIKIEFMEERKDE